MSAVTIERWRKMRKGALRGFADIAIGNLVLRDCGVFVGNDGRAWINLPSKPRLRDNQPVKDGNGKPMYDQCVTWANKDSQERFNEAAIEALTAAHRDALDD